MLEIWGDGPFSKDICVAQGLEQGLLDNFLKAAVIPVAYVPFPTTLLPSI